MRAYDTRALWSKRSGRTSLSVLRVTAVVCRIYLHGSDYIRMSKATVNERSDHLGERQ
jgi:hypothetical protein